MTYAMDYVFANYIIFSLLAVEIIVFGYFLSRIKIGMVSLKYFYRGMVVFAVSFFMYIVYYFFIIFKTLS